MEININCDLGESSVLHSTKNDPLLLNIVNSANIACGYHAGDEETMNLIVSISKKNVLRGIHGDYITWKLITCLHGKFLLLVVNNIKNHKEYKKSQIFELSEDNNLQILVPPGFGNSHYVKTKRAIFHYKQSTLYNKKLQFTIKWNNANFRFKWPFKSNPITSKRDRA